MMMVKIILYVGGRYVESCEKFYRQDELESHEGILCMLSLLRSWMSVEQEFLLKIIVIAFAQISRNLRRPILYFDIFRLESFNIHLDLFLLSIKTVEGDLGCGWC